MNPQTPHIRKPEGNILVLFGASGDLAKRKLIPALFTLCSKKLLPKNFAVLGVGRTAMSDDEFRTRMSEAIRHSKKKTPHDPAAIEHFAKRLHYQTIDTAEASEYAKIKQRIEELDAELNTGGKLIHYLATPPSLYQTIAENLAAHGLNRESPPAGWKRIIIEKPFGYDLESARALNAALHRVFAEEQIYRIDHYLGKETVQNMLAFRFANGIFEPLWNRNYIHHVEVTSVENIGVEGRGGYYDDAGALRDMVQNHLLQLVGMVAMEPPPAYNAEAVRNETLKVFQSLRPIQPEKVPEQVVRGQYTASTIRGEPVRGYREEPGVAPDSRTETFVAMRFHIDNWRWGGVPFYIRTGKRMPTRVTEVVIHFKRTPHRLFTRQYPGYKEDNKLVIRIQPDEGILLKFGMKIPGAGMHLQTVNMDFHYSDLCEADLPDAYERLLLDSMLGDATLYARADAVEACWKFITPILERWRNDPSGKIKIFGYPAGTWGPKEARDLFDDPGEDWRYPCKNLANDGLYCEL